MFRGIIYLTFLLALFYLILKLAGFIQVVIGRGKKRGFSCQGCSCSTAKTTKKEV